MLIVEQSNIFDLYKCALSMYNNQIVNYTQDDVSTIRLIIILITVRKKCNMASK